MQVFAFKASGKPELVDFDGDRYVLCEKKENKTTENYIFQYQNAPLFVQRLDALRTHAGGRGCAGNRHRGREV